MRCSWLFIVPPAVLNHSFHNTPLLSSAKLVARTVHGTSLPTFSLPAHQRCKEYSEKYLLFAHSYTLRSSKTLTSSMTKRSYVYVQSYSSNQCIVPCSWGELASQHLITCTSTQTNATPLCLAHEVLCGQIWNIRCPIAVWFLTGGHSF